jgi:hypothetical protein
LFNAQEPLGAAHECVFQQCRRSTRNGGLFGCDIIVRGWYASRCLTWA